MMKFPASNCVTSALLIVLFCGCTQGERFVEQPEDATVTQGQVHVIKCTVEDRIGEIQWLRDGFGLGPGYEFEGYPRYRVLHDGERGEYHLMIRDITLEDDAMFECQVGATVGTQGLKSQKAKLIVQVPIDQVIIAEGMSSVEVVSGQLYGLTCRALGGKPAASIVWQSPSGEVLTAADNVVTRHAEGHREDALSRLTLTPSRSDEGREYVCQALNAAMVEPMSASVQLNVQYKPELIIQALPSTTLKELNDVQFSCASDAKPELVTWKWFSDGKEILNELTSTLLLKSISYEMNGKEVSCEATNTIGSNKTGVALIVEYGPLFVNEPDNQPADLGESVTLTCDIQGNPPPVITWRRAGSDRILGTENSLRISPVTESDITPFTCSGSSVRTYQTVSRKVHVLRKGPPIILSTVDQSGRLGETATIECLVQAIPPPSEITWTKNGQDIEFSSLPRYRVKTDAVSYGLRSVIHIEGVQDSDFTAYNCSAKNDYGVKQLAISLTKKEVVFLPYVLTGVVAGILLIVIVCAVVLVYRRQKTQLPSDSMSHRSDDSADIKNSHHIPSDVKVEYSSNTVDDWQHDMILPPRYPPPPHIVDYADDEPRFPVKDSVETNSYRAMPDMYGYTQNSDRNPGHLSGSDIYGTYPRREEYPYETSAERIPPVYEPAFKSDIYATIGRSRSKQSRDFWPAPHSTSPTESHLSTNV